tara:strand:+ start:440 stop:1072 length:633 start_codon:yes stop_codon:yes gene_type:complete
MNLVIDITFNNKSLAAFAILFSVLYFESLYVKIGSYISNICKYLEDENEYTYLEQEGIDYDIGDDLYNDDLYNDDVVTVFKKDKKNDTVTRYSKDNKPKSSMYYIQNRDEKGLVEYVKNFGSTLILSDTSKADRHWIYKNVSKKDVYYKKVYTNKDNEVRFLMVDSNLLPNEDVDFDKGTVKLVKLRTYDVDINQTERVLNVDYKLSDMG